MVNVVALKKVPIVIMHMKGRPKNMQKKPKYENIVKEIYDFLEKQAQYAIDNGVEPKNIIIDPGMALERL